MAFLRPARAGPERSVEEAAEVAALTQFRLIQMLSTDRRALATARLLGLPLGERDKKVQQAAEPAPPPGGGAAGGGAKQAKARKPRKISEARKLVLEARPRAQAHRQRRMHSKFLQVIPLVSAYVRLGPYVARAAAATADASMQDAAAETGGAGAVAPPPPPPPPCFARLGCCCGSPPVAAADAAARGDEG